MKIWDRKRNIFYEEKEYGKKKLDFLYNTFSSRFNIVNILNIGYAKNVFEMIFLPLCLVIISLVILIIAYKNKEKFIIDCEKNN